MLLLFTLNFFEVARAPLSIQNVSSMHDASLTLLGRAQPVIPPNLYVLMNIIAWGPQVSLTK